MASPVFESAVICNFLPFCTEVVSNKAEVSQYAIFMFGVRHVCVEYEG